MAKATVEASIAAERATRGDFLNIGFPRGFASSQAYERNFPGQTDILQKRGKLEIDFDTSPFEGDRQPYPWLGFEARKILFEFLEKCAADPSVFVDVFAYDLSNPEVVQRLEAFGPRLRILVDDSDKHGKPKSNEAEARKRLAAKAGPTNVAHHHFSGLQHNKVIIAKRKTGNSLKPFAVLTGSTNLSLGRNLYSEQ